MKKGLKIIWGIIIVSFVLILIISFIPSSKSSEDEEPMPTKEEPNHNEIDYVIKARTASRMYIKDNNPKAKIPMISDEHGEQLTMDFVKDLYPEAKENYQYVYITGGDFTLDNEKYKYESLIGVEKDNKSATYGVSGIEIVYFKLLK